MNKIINRLIILLIAGSILGFVSLQADDEEDIRIGNTNFKELSTLFRKSLIEHTICRPNKKSEMLALILGDTYDYDWSVLGPVCEKIKKIKPSNEDSGHHGHINNNDLMVIDNQLNKCIEMINNNEKSQDLFKAICNHDLNEVKKIVESSYSNFGYWGSCTPSKKLALKMAQDFEAEEILNYLKQIWDVPSEDSWESTAINLMDWLCYLHPDGK